MDGINDFFKKEFKFLKWVEIITDENQAVKNSAMYILQKDLVFCDIIIVSDKGKKRRVGGVSKQILANDFPLLDLSNLSLEDINSWKQILGALNGEMPDHQWSGTSLSFEKPDGSFSTPVNLKGETGNISLITFNVNENMHLQMYLQTNTNLNFEIDNNGHLIVNN